MKTIQIIVILSLFVFIGWSQTRFCFPLCQQCDGPTYSQCRGTGCRAGTSFVKGTVTGSNFECIKAPYTYLSTGAKWQPTAVSSDIPAPTPYTMNTTVNITLQTLTLSTGTSKACTNGWNSITYFTGLTGPDTLTINHPGVSGNVFYWQVRIIYGILTEDNWNSNTDITTTFDTNLTSLPTPSTPVQLGNSRNRVCNSNSLSETYKVIIHSWTHTDPTPLDFSIKTSQTSTSKIWGVNNVIVSVRLCHPYCTICTGDSNINVCTACNYADQMAKLSGTTCNLACAIGYGDQTLDPSVCIVCQPLCRYCTDLPETCHDCNFPLLLFENTATNFSCISECPVHYYPDRTANDTCYICDISCENCTILPTKCTSCYPGTYLYNSQCINPCPAEYYGDDPTLTCKPCNKYCFTCAISSINCSVCDTTGPWISYLKLPNTCTTNCGDGFFTDTNNNLGPNLCLPCDTKCLTCAINSTYCFTCNATYYLLDNTCGSTCPFPEYFPDNATWKCLSCATYCVNMTMDVYWKNSLREELVCDLSFSQDLSWGPAEIQRFLQVTVNDPLISIDNFDLVYEAVAPNLMRLTLSPKGYAFIYNATFNFKTIPLQNGNYDYAANLYRFSDLNYDVSGTMVWFLIKAPSLSDTEKKIMDGVSGISTQVLSATTLPYVQQIKKAGIFAMLMGGAQITSTACLVNSIPSQNFYEGVRFWAAFVFFDVPPWEEDSKKSKYVVIPNVHDLIKDARLLQNDNYVTISNRTLFETSKINWRFLRTGHTSFFIFDTYINLFLMVLCWILLAISHYCIQLKNYKKRLISSFYSFTLKIHEISIFYISSATMLQWIYFDAASIERWISFGFCILFNVYFLVYELYIYYDMINYPAAVIGNSRYDYYSVRYGSYLKNIRFVQYDVNFYFIKPRQDWSFRHWFRPYNYHILSYYKKFLMMITLPIFYSTKNAQIIVLMIIQLFQIIRFIVVWPFKSKVRNFIRLGLEFILMIFFMSIIIQTSQITEIMINNPQTLQKAVDIFYKIGWLGFAACWTFNIGHIIIFIYDTIIGFKRTNRQLMDQARKIYYMEKLSAYEEENEDVPLHLVNRWVKLGNLNDRKLQQLPDLNLRVEYFRIQKTRNGFEIDLKKLFEVFMNIEFNYQKENNLTTGKKLNKHISLTRSLSPTFYGIIENLYNQYMANFDFQFMTIKTFQKVIQSEHKPGEQIHLNPKIMKQRIIIQTIAGQKRMFHMQKLLPGFPLSNDDLKHLA